MQKILHSVPKNRWFVKRVWWPITFIQESIAARVEVNSETGEREVKPVPKDTDYEFVQVGWGAQVYCKVLTSLRSPNPVVQYMSIDRAREQWLQDAVSLLVQEGLEVDDARAFESAKDLMKRYTMNATPLEAVNDYYADALGLEQEAEGE